MNIIIYLILILTLECFAGAPPSVKPKIITGKEAPAVSTIDGLNIQYGYYYPSLKMLNNDLKLFNIPTIHGGTYLTVGWSENLMAERWWQTAHMLLDIGYWRGETNWIEKNTKYKLGITFWIFNGEAGPLLPVIHERLYVTPGVIIRDVLVDFRYSSNSDYYTAMTFIIDIGGKIGTEYFVIPGYKQLSIGADIGYIIWGFMLGDLRVYDSTYSNIRGGTVLYASDLKNKMKIETNGLILKFRVNFYF